MTTEVCADQTAGRLIELLGQQHLLYRQLKDLAVRQRQMVDGGQGEMLLKVLAGRQRLIDRLILLDRELRPLRQQWQEITEKLPADQRARAGELLEEIKAMLADILDSDRQDSDRLSDQRQDVTQALGGAARGRQAHRAYAGTAAVGGAAGRYVDFSTD